MRQIAAPQWRPPKKSAFPPVIELLQALLKMKLRIGLIGLGDAWQTRHRPALRMLDDRFDVRAVFSPVAKLAENSAAEFQADAMDGYRSLVSRFDIDAVMVLSRTWHGWLPMLAAADAGKSVYWAGDLEFDSKRDANVRSAIEESGVAFMVEFPRRFAPATLRLRELIATRLGEPRLVFCHRRLPSPKSQATGADRNDLLRREMIELIDWCSYVVNRPPESVTSMIGDGSGAVGYRSFSIGFPAIESSPIVTAQISCGDYIRSSWEEAASFRPPSEMQVCCERGIAFIDLPSTLVWFDDAGRHLESLDTELPVGEQLLTQFHRAVTSLVRNISDLDNAYRAASVLAAGLQSDEAGRRIVL